MLRVLMSDLTKGERELDAEQARYVLRVHRLRTGDRFVAFDPKRSMECDVEIVARKHVRLSDPRAVSVSTGGRSITWIHGCPKGDKSDAIVRDATELGATLIVFAHTARVVGRTRATRLARWERVAREASRQCGRGDVPEVTLAATFEEALASVDAETRVCLHPTGQPLASVLAAAHGSLAFAAGPEGGFTEGELREAANHGFISCQLGAYVLRTETAAAAALGAAALFSAIER
jgi:16S rRNA (uracil1498-N3)-methyltransferase